MPKVIIWRDGAIETEFDPGHRDWRMGRSETNDITLLDPRKSVSRFHAELREENGRWVFIDLNSQNGSWKDGQRVNRLVLEHGHEVLFGDYKMAFEDVRVAAPPPPPLPSTADVTMDVHAATADVPIPPDQTLLLPGKVQPAAPAPPGSGSAPVLRAPVKPKPTRKGVNPLILVLFLIAMLGAAAAVAWKVLSSDPAEPRVAERTEATPPETAPEPVPEPAAPVVPPGGGAADPSLGATPGAPPDTAAPPAASSVPPAAASPPASPAAPVAGLPVVAAPPPVAGAVTPPAPRPGGPPRPRRTPPPAAPKDNPAVVTRYEDGRRALAAGRFAEAERAFAAVLAEQPDFRDTTALLAQARGGQAAAREASLTEARALEASGDWPRAIAAYERAGASDGADGARTKMTAAGDDAYRKARQFDARNRPIDAMTWYQRAAAWLPDSDPRKVAAQERLAALKGGGGVTDAELDGRLAELLVSSKALDSSRVDTAKVYQQARGGTLAGSVLALNLATDKVVRMLLEEITGIKTVDPSLMTVYPDFLDRVNTLVPAQVWLAMMAFPAQMEVNRLHVCMVNPTDARYRRSLESLSGCQVVPLLATEPAVTAALTRHYAAAMQGQAPLRCMGEASLDVAEAAYGQTMQAPFAQYVDGAASFANRTRDTLGQGAQGLELLAREPVIIRLVHQIIARSVESGASDIHVEPSEGRLRVRARVDGALRVLHDLPPSVILPVTARLKAMADVPLTAAVAPIDARIGYDLVWGRPVDLRFSLVPSISGEKVVMRVLDRARQRRDLGDLGVDPETKALLEEASDLPNGLLLVTGPTGSGKSSTLYALLDRLNTEDECILTAEDPVESRILGVTQVQCDADELTYAMALRSFLRQDPDVIMVGEVRDAETADIALKAALTGHMVLSSLHTNDAAGAVLRLLNMGLESFIVASSLRLVVAQRLVRRLCKECKVPVEIDVRTHPLTAAYERLHHHGRVSIREPQGCPACGGAGYRGRTGIFEVLRMSPAIEDMVMRRASVSEIRLQAHRDGMRTLREAALAKVVAGETSLAEVLEHTVAVETPVAVPA